MLTLNRLRSRCFSRWYHEKGKCPTTCFFFLASRSAYRSQQPQPRLQTSYLSYQEHLRAPTTRTKRAKPSLEPSPATHQRKMKYEKKETNMGTAHAPRCPLHLMLRLVWLLGLPQIDHLHTAPHLLVVSPFSCLLFFPFKQIWAVSRSLTKCCVRARGKARTGKRIGGE